MMHRYQKRTFGFTLIEIMLVVILISVVTSLTVVRFSKSFKRLQSKQAAENIAYVLRYAKSRAVAKRAVVRLYFNEEKTKYWLEEVSQEEDETAFWREQESFDYESRVFVPLSGGMSKKFSIPEKVLLQTNIEFIEFYPDGLISEARLYVCQEKFCQEEDSDCQMDCLTVSTQDVKGGVKVFDYRVE